MKALINLIFFTFIILLLVSCASNQQTPFSRAKMNFKQQNYHNAFEQSQTLAKQGNPEAQYALGYMYYSGEGTAVNKPVGQDWILKAAQAGDQNAKQALQMIITREQRIMPSVKINPEMLAAVAAKTPQTVTVLPSKSTTKAIEKPTSVVKTAVNYTADEQALLAMDPKHYTLQLLDATTAKYAATYIEKHKLSTKAKYFHRKLKDKDLYVIVYGNYPSHKAAIQAIKTLPNDIQALRPWVKNISSVQSEIQAST